MNRILLAFGLMCMCYLAQAQTVNEIKNDRKTYIYGEGKAMSIQQADKQALDNIVSQIAAITVSGNITSTTGEAEQGDKLHSESEFEQIIKTYSQATLVNTQQIIIATAAHFKSDVKGDYLTLNNKKYIVCDPTYINANVGEAMPQFKQSKAKIIMLD